MTFDSFTNLINQINKDLGLFCNEFQYKRIQLNGKERVAERNALFGTPEKDRSWAINKGGGTELQYHITIDSSNERIRYGLGFNTQYVPHANEMSMVEYMKPYMKAFLSLQTELIVAFPSYILFYGSLDDLKNPQQDRYVLWGNEVPLIKLNADNFEVEDDVYQKVLTDLRNQFGAYVKIFNRRNEILKMGKSVKRFREILEHKHQLILQGPPGTGKTYTAKDIAEEMIFGDVTIDKKLQKERLESSNQFKLIQFHPAYSYEDFVRGITVEANGSNVHYKSENKVLGHFAQEAAKAESQDKKYVLVIDEINRANLPAVLGELIYALEYRGHTVESMYKLDGGDNTLVLPENLFIIGTMNTSDRSIGHIDYAIRRRFAFENVLPNKNVVHDLSKNLFKKVSELFVEDYDNINWNNPVLKKSKHIAQDFNPEDVWIGHSYFISKHTKEEDALKELQLKLSHEIKPLLREYVKDGILREDIPLEKAECMLDYINKLSL